MTAEEKLIAIIEEDPEALSRALAIVRKARAAEVKVIDAQVVLVDEQPAATVKRLREQLTALQSEVETLKREWAAYVADVQAREHRNLNRLDAYLAKVRETVEYVALLLTTPEDYLARKEAPGAVQLLRELCRPGGDNAHYQIVSALLAWRGTVYTASPVDMSHEDLLALLDKYFPPKDGA